MMAETLALTGMLEARAKLIAENIRRTAQGAAPVNLIPSRE